MLFEYSPKIMGPPLIYKVLQPIAGLCNMRYPLASAIPATVLLVKATEEVVIGSPLTIFVPNGVEALLNSHHIQHLSASCLTSYKILLLTVPHITLCTVIVLPLSPFFPSLWRITLMTNFDSHLLTPIDDLQETPLDNMTFHGL